MGTLLFFLTEMLEDVGALIYPAGVFCSQKIVVIRLFKSFKVGLFF